MNLREFYKKLRSPLGTTLLSLGGLILLVLLCLPLLLRAVSDGYILEQGKETIEGQPCLRLALDATLPSGEKVLCTGWFYGADLTPCYAEFSQDGKLLVSARITYFTFEAAPDGS